MTQTDTSEEELYRGGKVMSLFGHLNELRVRIVLAAIGIFVVFCGCLFFSTELLILLKQPLVKALPKETTNSLHFTGPLDVFMISIKVSFLASIVLASPIWLYQFWRFVEPALYPKERRFVLPFFLASLFLFLGGIAFCFGLVLPMGLEFLISFGADVGTPIITITDYMSLVVVMIFGFGFIFETPLVLILLGVLKIVNAKMLRSVRKHVVVLSLFVAALITPPDPVSQIAMAIPLYIMYEISIFVIGLMEKRR